MPKFTHSRLSRVAEAVADSLYRPITQIKGMWHVLTTEPATATDSNIRNLFIEIAFAAVLSGAATFNSAFALRLGASNTEIGLLSSIPALLAILVLIPSGQILGQRSQRMPLINGSLFIHRLMFLLVALVPLVPHIPHGTAVVLLLIAAALPAHFFGVGWNSMLADVIPEARRARVFAIRSILAAIVATTTIYIAGLWLDRVVFPANYQVMYLVGFGASMLSSYYILKLQVPDSFVPPPRPQQAVNLHVLWQRLAQACNDHRDFLRITCNTFLHGVGLWMIAPLYILYYVRQLNATDGWIGLNGTLANLTPILGFYLWQRCISRWGENAVLKRTIVLVGLYPLLVGLTSSLHVILLWTALNGLIVPGVNLSHFPLLLKVCPAVQRPQYIGIYSTIMNIGAFVMPLVGVFLAERVGFAPMLIAGGLMSVIGSSSFIFSPLRTVDSRVRDGDAATS